MRSAPPIPDELLALTLWPEWAWAFGLPGLVAKRVENRGWAPPRRLVGREAPVIALHAGAHIGGRKGAVAAREGVLSVATMARRAGALVSLSRVEDMRTGGWALNVRCPVSARDRWAAAEGFRRPLHFPFDVVETPIVRSAVVGLLRIESVLRPGEEPQTIGIKGWRVPDAWGWVCDFWPLATPVACDGHQGLWPVEPAIVAAIRDQVDR